MSSDASGYGGKTSDGQDVTFSNIQNVNVFADLGTVNFGANGIAATADRRGSRSKTASI